MHIHCCTCSNNVICDWNILVNNITRWIHVFLQCFLDQNHYFFIFSEVIMKMGLMKNNPILCFTKIFTPLSAFKILQVFLPGIFHCLCSRLCFVVLTRWYCVHSRSPPNTPLATRSHTFVSPHDTQIRIPLNQSALKYSRSALLFKRLEKGAFNRFQSHLTTTFM
jgi:hypothetical protein